MHHVLSITLMTMMYVHYVAFCSFRIQWGVSGRILCWWKRGAWYLQQMGEAFSFLYSPKDIQICKTVLFIIIVFPSVRNFTNKTLQTFQISAVCRLADSPSHKVSMLFTHSSCGQPLQKDTKKAYNLVKLGCVN